jgi:hypothetical protein
MTPTEAYQLGVENGRLCRKYSNQHVKRPTDQEWVEAVDDVEPVNYAEYIRGCNDGWDHASGASKI